MYVGSVYNDNIRIVLDRATVCIPYSADLTEPAIGVYLKDALKQGSSVATEILTKLTSPVFSTFI